MGEWNVALTVEGDTLGCHALVDTARGRKSVAGVSWVSEFSQPLSEKKLPWRKASESEPFRFGSGPRIMSHSSPCSVEVNLG